MPAGGTDEVSEIGVVCEPSALSQICRPIPPLG